MKKRKILAAALALSMTAIPFLTACNNGGGSGAGTSKTGEATGNVSEGSKDSQTSNNAGGGTEYYVSDEKQKFSIFLNFNNMPFDPQWPVWQEVQKLTNVELEASIPQSNSDEAQAFQLMLSDNNLSDIIGYVDMTALEQLGFDGGLIPLNDLIKEYAPNIQKMLDEDDAFRRVATAADGNIYFIPRNQENRFAEFYWIRQDWLDKLSLEVPDTVEDLYKVLTAFKNDDPNGNNEKDEVPFFDRAGHKHPDEILYLWDSSIQFYPRDGHLMYDPMHENFKYGMEQATKWYKEGLIDQTYFTRGPSGRDELMSANQGGFTHDWSSASNYNKSLAKDVPGLEMVAIAPPKDQNGNRVERTVNMPGVGWGISVNAKNPEMIMKFFDFLFTEKGQTYMDWGIEGVSYDVNADGSKVLREDFLAKEGTPIGNLRAMGSRYRVGYPSTLEAELSTYSEYARAAAEMYQKNTDWYRQDVPPYADGQLELKLTPEESTEFNRIMGPITTYVQETYTQWILGTKDFASEYDAFIAELENRNIARATEIMDGAYQRYLGKN